MTDPRHVFLALAGWERADASLCDGPARWRDPAEPLSPARVTGDALRLALRGVLLDAGWCLAPCDPRAPFVRRWQSPDEPRRIVPELDALDHLARVEPRPLHVAAYRAARAATLRVVAGGATGSSGRQTVAGRGDGGEGGSAA